MNGKSQVSVSCLTWNRDSHGLYDYENPNVKPSKFVIHHPSAVFRSKIDVKAVSHRPLFPDEEKLVQIEENNGHFLLKNELQSGQAPNETNINSLQNMLWLPVKGENFGVNGNPQRTFNEFISLELNDIIMLGRIKYVVTQLRLTKNEDAMDVDSLERKRSIFELTPEVQGRTYQNDCKICLSNFQDENNLMVSLCSCSGSISSTHIYCLQKWMETKVTQKFNDTLTVSSYNFNSFNCEICKKPYPLQFERCGVLHSMINIVLPVDHDYMVLESLDQNKENSNIKSVHVIKLYEGAKVILGRGHDCDIRVNDISVSRKHACFEVIDGQVILKDLYSKFGTLVLQQKDIQIGHNPIHLQIGRSLVNFSLETKQAENIKEKQLKVVEKSSPKSSSGDSVRCDGYFECFQLNQGMSRPKPIFKVERMESPGSNGSLDKNAK